MAEAGMVMDLSRTLSEGTMDQLRQWNGDIDCISPEVMNAEDNIQMPFGYPNNNDGIVNGISYELPGTQFITSGYDQSFQNFPEFPQGQHVSQVPQQQEILPVPQLSPSLVTHPVPTSYLLSNENIPGDFGFDIGFEQEQAPLVKAARWTYSTKLNKMYAKNKVDVPIRFMLTGAFPEAYEHLFVRVVVVYTNTEHSRTPVQRCPNHESPGSRKHIFECCNSNSLYGISSDGHYFVTFPFRHPEAGQQYILEFIRFTCLNTCPGGPDRRRFHCVFLLEQNDVIVGKRILNMKISTTPGRDKPKEEAKVPRSKSKVKHEDPAPAPPQPPPPPPPQQVAHHAHQGPEQHTVNVKEEEDDEIYTIQVRGRKKYEELMKIKEYLDLRDQIPQQLLDTYRASCPPCGPNWLLEQQRQGSNPDVQTTTSVTSLPSTSHQHPNLPQKNSTRFTLKRHTKPHITERTSQTIPEN